MIPLLSLLPSSLLLPSSPFLASHHECGLLRLPSRQAAGGDRSSPAAGGGDQEEAQDQGGVPRGGGHKGVWGGVAKGVEVAP